jgi:enoyl-CoA hydratase/carnithine racemase
MVLHQTDKPVICALNGAAAGYGLDLALGCDIRIAAEGAKLAAVFTKRGVLPESGGTWLLPRLIGWSKAAELAFTGRTLSAQQALELGLVSSVVPAEALMPEARKLAAEIAANAPLAVQAIGLGKRMDSLKTDDALKRQGESVRGLPLVP